MPGFGRHAVLLLALAACRRGPPPGEIRLAFFPNVTHAQALVGEAEGEFAEVLEAATGNQPLEAVHHDLDVGLCPALSRQRCFEVF